MNEREKKLIALVGFLAVLLIIYYALYRPIMKEKEVLEGEIEVLNTTVGELRVEYDKMPFYEEEIVNSKDRIALIESNYPAGISQESGFKLLFDIESHFTEVEFKDIGFSDITTLSYSDERQDENTLRAIAQIMTTGGDFTYTDLKELIRFLGRYEDRSVLSNLNMTLNEEENLITTTFAINQYALEGGGRIFEIPQFDAVPKGKDQPFDSPTMNYVPRDELTRESDPSSDLFVILKPTASDGNAQIMGLTSDETEATYITSDVNQHLTGSLRIFEESGQTYVTYSYGGQSKNKQAFNLGNALELDLFASRRIDEDDLSSMTLQISNEIDKTLYINVKEEDKNSPRLEVEILSGQVIFD